MGSPSEQLSLGLPLICGDGDTAVIKEGPGRSHADPGLKFGNARGPLAFNNCSMNTFYEAFATAFPAVKRVVLDALPRSI